MKITKRDFLIGGLASILISKYSPAIVIRSNIAGREQAFSSELGMPDVPYVKDGLVAMWDGIWNTGYEEHDNSSEVWADITRNGNDAIINKSESYTKTEPFDEIAARVDGTFSFMFVPSAILVNAMQGSCTVEILCSCAVPSMADNTPYISVGGYNMSIMNSAGTVGNLKARPFINNEVQDNSSGIGHIPFKSRAFVKSIDGNNAICSWYYRGTFRKEETRTFQAGTPSIGYLFGGTGNQYFGGKGRWWDSGEDGYAYGMRVYNRVLTQDEIAYNFAIDAERFGF